MGFFICRKHMKHFLISAKVSFNDAVHHIRSILMIILISHCVTDLKAFHVTDSSMMWKTIKGQAQGTSYLIKYLQGRLSVKKEQIDSILNDIDQSLSLYRKDSRISRFNNSRAASPSDIHLSTVISTSLTLMKLSHGAFDFRMYDLSKAWGFGPTPAKRVPSARKIHRLKPKDADTVWLDGNTICKSRRSLHIDLDGIAQGYSVDVLASFLQAQQLRDYIVELGGEIRTSGFRPDGTAWRIGVESPVNSDLSHTLMVSPGNGAITTSGSYRKTRSFGGRIYSHVIHPKTGRPIDNGMLSCTVLAPTAMLADALDNVGMVLGPEAFLKMIEGLPNINAFLVWRDQQGKIHTRGTAGFQHKIIQQIQEP